MYKCIKAVFPVLTFDKSYQVGQEISDFEFENLEVKLRDSFEAIVEVEAIDASKGLEGIPETTITIVNPSETVTGNPDAPEPIVFHLNGESKDS